MAVALLVVVAAAASVVSPQASLPPPLIGDTAPAFAGVTAEGRRPPTAHDGDILVVDFFATWCGPCHQALRDLAAIRSALGPRVRFVLVDAGEEPKTVQAFVARTSLPEGAAIILDPSGEVTRRWGSAKLPTTFLVDGAGIIRHINRGWGPGYEARLLRWLRAMLLLPPASP